MAIPTRIQTVFLNVPYDKQFEKWLFIDIAPDFGASIKVPILSWGIELIVFLRSTLDTSFVLYSSRWVRRCIAFLTVS